MKHLKVMFKGKQIIGVTLYNESFQKCLKLRENINLFQMWITSVENQSY